MPDTEIERRGTALVFRVLKGEWWNHLAPGVLWLMEHDSVEYPPAQWHRDLRALPESELQEADRIIVDMTACNNVIFQDLGELVRLKEKHARRPALVASDRIVRAYKVLRGLDALLSLHTTIEDALARPRREPREHP